MYMVKTCFAGIVMDYGIKCHFINLFILQAESFDEREIEEVIKVVQVC